MSLAVMPSSARFLVSRALIAGLALSMAAANRAESEGSSPFVQPVAGIAPGPIAGSYPLSGFDSVNLFNGNVSLHLPILTVGGRGEAGYTITLASDSRRWTAESKCPPGDTCSPSPGATPAPLLITPRRRRVDYALPEVGYGPGRMEVRYSTTNTNACYNHVVMPLTSTRLVFTSPDGSEIVFRDANAVHSDGFPAKGRPELALCETIEDVQAPPRFNRKTKWVSMDSVSASYENETDISDCPGESCELVSPLNGYLMFRNGLHYRIDQGRVSYIYDRNGNKVSFTYESHPAPGGGNSARVTKIVDSLNREIHVDYEVVDQQNGALLYDAISYYGAQANPSAPAGAKENRQRVIKVYRYRLDEVLRAVGTNGEAVYPAPLTFRVLFAPFAVEKPDTVYNGQDFVSEEPRASFPGYLILPNGTFYRFLYNPYGELAQVDVPTGGSYHYDYQNDFSDYTEYLGSYHLILGRRLVARRTYDEHGLRSTTTYTSSLVPGVPYPQTQTQVTVRQLNSQGGLEGWSEHFFYGHPRSIPRPLGESDWSDGREFKTQVFTAGGTLLRQTDDDWFQEALPWWETPEKTLTGPPNGPVVKATTTTLDGGLVSRKTFGYDEYFNLADVFEYDFGLGSPGGLLRHRQTSYLTFGDRGDYVSSFPGQFPGAHVRNLPTDEKVFDGQGVLRRWVKHAYDEGTLLRRPNISGAPVTDPWAGQ